MTARRPLTQDEWFGDLLATDSRELRRDDHVRENREARAQTHFYGTGDGIPATGEHRSFEDRVMSKVERIKNYRLVMCQGELVHRPETDREFAARKAGMREQHLRRLARGTRGISF